MNKFTSQLDSNNSDFTLLALNDMFSEIEKLNKRIKRVKFMNKLYFGFAVVFTYSVYTALRDEIKELKKEKTEE